MDNRIEKPNPSVAIIILNYNGAEDTIECLNSLNQLKYANKKIIVVDNASSGNDVEQIKENFGHSIDLIKNSRNEGYAQGNNIGLNWAKQHYQSDFYWILNNDTVVDSDSLTELVKYAGEHPEIDIFGNYIQYWQSSLIYCLGGGVINLWTGIDKLWGARLDYHRAFIPSKFSYISGCSLFFSKKVLINLKGFDPDYFLYNEEADFCFRAGQAGYCLSYVPEAKIFHKSAQSTGYHSPVYIYYFLRNKLIFMKKNCREWHYPTYILIFLFYYCSGFILKNWKKNKFLTISVIWQSISDFFGKRWSCQPIRKSK